MKIKIQNHYLLIGFFFIIISCKNDTAIKFELKSIEYNINTLVEGCDISQSIYLELYMFNLKDTSVLIQSNYKNSYCNKTYEGAELFLLKKIESDTIRERLIISNFINDTIVQPNDSILLKLNLENIIFRTNFLDFLNSNSFEEEYFIEVRRLKKETMCFKQKVELNSPNYKEAYFNNEKVDIFDTLKLKVMENSYLKIK